MISLLLSGSVFKSLRAVSIVLMSVVCVIGFACEEQRLQVNVDNYMQFLNINQETQQGIRPLLVSASEIGEEYNNAIAEGTSRSLSRVDAVNELLQLKIDTLERLFPTMKGINEGLNDNQRNIWRRSELYYFYFDTRDYIFKHYRSNLDLSYNIAVTPGVTISEGQGFRQQSPVEQWTVYFGLPMYSFYTGNTSKSISQEARRSFPISIQATLMDKSLRKFETGKPASLPSGLTDDSVIEIRVLLSSRLHPNFSDIDNWIPFLEMPDGRQIEPKMIIEKDKNWFEERNMLLSSRIPEFLSSPEPQVDPGVGRGVSSMRGRFERFDRYYQLIFPAELSNTPVLSPETRSIELVFLEEIGSEKRAKGTWRLNWRQP